MGDRTTKKTKRPFVVVLPRELSGEDKVIGYAEIPKIGGGLATDAHAAVLKYLHRFHENKARLIFDKLRKRCGGIEGLAFELPEIVVGADGKKIKDPDEARQAMEYFLAYDIATCYYKEPTSEQMFAYIANAKKIISDFLK